MYLIMTNVGLLVSSILCWIIDYQLYEKMHIIGGFNPQLHGWWHIICGIDSHVGIVCVEAMFFLSIKYKHYQMKDVESCEPSFKTEDHCVSSFTSYYLA